MSSITDYTLHKFVRDRRSNPYSGVVDNFLKRQLLLATHITLIVRIPLLRELNFSGYLLTVPDRCNQKNVEFARTIIDKRNKAKSEKVLTNYLTMSLLAQAFENFEMLIRDMYRVSLNSMIINKFILEEAKSRIPRNNVQVISDLKQLFPSLSPYLNDYFYQWFHTMEQMRHAIVHNDQIITKKGHAKMSAKVLAQYFEVTPYKNGTFSAKLQKNTALEAMKLFDRFGYNIFAFISRDAKRPIKYIAQPLKRPTPPPKMTKAEFDQKVKEMLAKSRSRKTHVVKAK